MAVAQQEQQRYADRIRAQAPKDKVGDKVWLTLENITTATESKKLDAKQVKYTATFFTLIDCVQPQWTLFSPKLLTIATRGLLSSMKKPPNMTLNAS